MSLKFNDDVKIKFVQLMKINTAHLKNISNYKKLYWLIATFFLLLKYILYVPSSEWHQSIKLQFNNNNSL